jgi:hypothetical protein
LIAWLYSELPGHGDTDNHLFEVKKGASIYSSLYKPGQVKSGQTWVKLSSSEDPYRYRKDYLTDDEEEEDQLSSDVEEDVEKEEEDSDDCEDEEQEDWKWEDEEEFTLGHAWPKGPELERAIVYVSHVSSHHEFALAHLGPWTLASLTYNSNSHHHQPNRHP